MTKRLTTEQLEAIRKRAEAATAGNWGIREDYTEDHMVIGGADGRTVIGELRTLSDSIFLSKSRTDIPALLAEVERLRTALIEIADIDDWDYGLEIAKNITFKTIGEPKGWDGIDND